MFRTFRDETQNATPRICAKLTTSDPDWDTFVRQYTGVADDLEMELPYNWGSLKGQLVQLVPDRPAPRKVCPKPFFELMVKANGDVSACCVDWAGQLNLGNVQTHTLKEIWEGQSLAEIRRAHRAGLRFQMPACSNCNLPDVTPDNLDHFRGW
jgi:radical SAM protein with 4Fe4S-binding SPASM domain